MKNSVIASIGIGVAVAVIAGIIIAGGFDSTMPTNTPQPTVIDDTDKIKVFASFFPYYEFTKNVAGDHAIVEQYLPFGVGAHDWEPRALEIQSLEDADVFVYTGLGIESYVDNLIESGEFNHVLFLKASESVQLIKTEMGHAEEFIEELEAIIEEYEHGHINESQTLEQIEEILHQHEGDGHDHGNQTIEGIEELLHEVEDGHFSPEQGIEEIHHFILGMEEDEHGDEAKDEGHEDEHEDEGHEDEHDGHNHELEFDPHIWLDPILAKHQVNTLETVLSQ